MIPHFSKSHHSLPPYPPSGLQHALQSYNVLSHPAGTGKWKTTVLRLCCSFGLDTYERLGQWKRSGGHVLAALTSVAEMIVMAAMRASCSLGHCRGICSRNHQFVCNVLIGHLPDCGRGRSFSGRLVWWGCPGSHC